MKKGFTLIELLAVIVILAIIAVIATPIVLSIIKSSKTSSNLRSTENYLDAAEQAIARINLKESFIPTNCTVQDHGNLLCDGRTEQIEVDVNGKTPDAGAILKFNKGSVIGISKFSIDSNTILASSLKLEEAIEILCKAAKNLDTVKVLTSMTWDSNEKKYLVTYADVTAGKLIDRKNPYELGTKYICTLGDGIDRIFYVLEDGDKTTLTKWDQIKVIGDHDNVGTAGVGEVSLIMSENINEEVTEWLTYDDYIKVGGSQDEYDSYYMNVKGPVTAMSKLPTNGTWTKLESSQIAMPTYKQAVEIGCGGYQEFNTCPSWFCGTSTEEEFGYWLLSASNPPSTTAWSVCNGGYLMSIGVSNNINVRPVITLSKTQLSP